MKPAIWRIFQNGRWSYADQPSTNHLDRLAWQPLYASAGTDAGREVLAAWMIRQGYSTGHGDTIEDLLQELELNIAESWTRALVNGVEGEREACAKLCDRAVKESEETNTKFSPNEVVERALITGAIIQATRLAAAIRARGRDD